MCTAPTAGPEPAARPSTTWHRWVPSIICWMLGPGESKPATAAEGLQQQWGGVGWQEPGAVQEVQSPHPGKSSLSTGMRWGHRDLRL